MRFVTVASIVVMFAMNSIGFADERCTSCETADQDLIEAQASADQAGIDLQNALQRQQDATESLRLAEEHLETTRSAERELFTRVPRSCNQTHFETVITHDRQLTPQATYAQSIQDEAQAAVTACMNPTPRCVEPTLGLIQTPQARAAFRQRQEKYQTCLNGGAPNVPYGETYLFIGYKRNAQQELIRSYYTPNSVQFQDGAPNMYRGAVIAGAVPLFTQPATLYLTNERNADGSRGGRTRKVVLVEGYLETVDQNIARKTADRDAAIAALAEAERNYEDVLKRHNAFQTRLENASVRSEYCQSDEWQSFVAQTCQAPSANADSEKLFEMSQTQLTEQCPVAEEYGLSISESCMLANKPVDQDLNAKAREIVAGECKLELDDAAAACLSLRR